MRNIMTLNVRSLRFFYNLHSCNDNVRLEAHCSFADDRNGFPVPQPGNVTGVKALLNPRGRPVRFPGQVEGLNLVRSCGSPYSVNSVGVEVFIMATDRHFFDHGLGGQ